VSIVINVENISKQYRLGDVGTGALAHDVNKWWHKVRGKENPYLKIGETNDRSVKGESDYVWALKDINFEVKQGEVLGIIGRNGAGKSTLLKILSKTTTPTTGSIKIKGRIASLLEVGTGFHPELSGRDNIFLNGAILGMTKREIKSKFDEIVDFAGVERYIDTPVKRYSSGMYVRLAFGVAAHLEPEILIVDEVLAVGDAEFQKKALGKMKDVSEKDGRTVLFVSHNLEAVSKLCNRGILMDSGFLRIDDKLDAVLVEYVKAFKNNVTGNESIKSFQLNSEVQILNFEFSKQIIKEFDQIDFELKIVSNKINPIDGLAILFYNSAEERIAIIDLRNDELFKISNEKKEIHLKGTIDAIPFIAGEYFVGIALGSLLVSGNFKDLINISIRRNVIGGITNYSTTVLGYVSLKTDFKHIKS